MFLPNTSLTLPLIGLLLTSMGCKSADQSFSAQNQDIYTDSGFAEISVTPTELVFTEVADGITYSLSFTVESIGENALQIDKVDITNSANGVFYIDTSATQDITLETGVSRDFIVIAQAVTADTYLGEARIRSNDASHGDIRIPLCTFPVGFTGELRCVEEVVDTGIEQVEDTGTAGN